MVLPQLNINNVMFYYLRAKQCDSCWISSKIDDIVRDKIYRNNLITQAQVAHILGEEREAERPQPVLEADHDHVVGGGQHGGVGVLQRPEIEASRVNPDHDGKQSLRDPGGKNTEVETVLVCAGQVGLPSLHGEGRGLGTGGGSPESISHSGPALFLLGQLEPERPHWRLSVGNSNPGFDGETAVTEDLLGALEQPGRGGDDEALAGPGHAVPVGWRRLRSALGPAAHQEAGEREEGGEEEEHGGVWSLLTGPRLGDGASQASSHQRFSDSWQVRGDY